MWNIQFTHDRHVYFTRKKKDLISIDLFIIRLVIAVNKTLSDIPQAKRNGKLVTDWTLRAIHTDINKSTEAACSYLYQDTFLPRVLEKLRKNPNQIIQDMNDFRAICKLSSSFFFIVLFTFILLTVFYLFI